MAELLQTYNLAEVTDQYLMERFIKNKKYYPAYLSAARLTWRDIFQNTIWSVQSQWMPLKKGEPYNYVDVPLGMQRFFSASIVNHCNNIVPLYYNTDINIIPQPKQSACGCTACTCSGGLCDDIGGLTKLTELLFTVNGTNYYQTTWLKLCPNGDILEYRLVPTKKYNTYTGDGGDYNNDYNNDYLIEHPPFSDYTIETVPFQKILCKIDVKPCGCPENTVENEDVFLQHCGCYCQPFANCIVNQKRRFCERVIDDTNYDDCALGTVKMSECGTRIYYVPPHRGHGQLPAKLPKNILVNFQTSGENCNEMVQVPEFGLETMFYGIDFRTKRFSGMLNFKEKQAVKYEYISAQNNLILYLNPFSLSRLAQIQDVPILY